MEAFAPLFLFGTDYQWVMTARPLIGGILVVAGVVLIVIGLLLPAHDNKAREDIIWK